MIATLAALITACAVFAPVVDRAVAQATVRVRLAQTPVSVTGLQITSRGQYLEPGLDHATLTSLVPPDVRADYGPPVPSTTVTVTRLPGGSSSPTGPLMWRRGMCAHLSFTSGGCPRAVDQVAISVDDARNYHWRVGSRLGVQETVVSQAVPQDASPPRVTMTVEGVYRPRPGTYWSVTPLTGRSGTTTQGGTRQPLLDTWLTPRAGLVDGPEADRWVDPVNEVDLELARTRVGVDQIIPLGPAMTRFVQDPARTYPVEASDPPPAVLAHSGVADVASQVARGREQARVIVPLLMIQLGLLAVFVLWLVLGAATEQRRPELAVARLRGRGVAGARNLLLAELGTIVLAGLVVGVIVALGMSYAARHLWLPLDPPFELGTGFLVAVPTALAVLVLMVVAASQMAAREPVSDLLRRVPARRTGWAVGAADTFVVTASAVAFVAFATGGLEGPLALAAPGLLALLVGLVLSHALVPVSAAAGARLLSRGRLALGVSLLQLARRPATRRVVAVVTVACALLVFSADALTVGARNRSYAAGQQNGAPLVATVSGTDVAGVRAALQRLDPEGTTLTPVVMIAPPGESGTTTQAVIPGQFARIGLFAGRQPSAAQWARLDPPAVAPLRLTGRSVSLRVASAVRSRGVEPVVLSLRMVGPDGTRTLVTVDRMAVGRRPGHTVRAAVPCVRGCLVTGVSVESERGRTARGDIALSTLRTSAGQRVPVGPAANWRAGAPGPPGSIRPSAASGAGGPAGMLALSFVARGIAPVDLDHAALPARLPALVVGGLPPGSTGADFDGSGLDGVTRPMVRAARLPHSPGAPAATSVVNLDVLGRDGAALDPSGTVAVWFARDDPALLTRVRRVLAGRGMSLTAVSHLAATRRTYDESAPAWSLQLATLVGGVALLVAAFVLVLVAATSWRQRCRDFAALRMSGLPRSRVSVMTATEQLVVVGLAVLAGSVCGVVGAHLALPTVPLFDTPPAVSTLDLRTAWGAVAVSAAAAAVCLGLVGWATSRWLAEHSEPQRIRESS